jgi:fumarate hydratase class II
VAQAVERGVTIREVVVADGLLTAEQYEELLTPEAVCRLGHPQPLGRPVED